MEDLAAFEGNHHSPEKPPFPSPSRASATPHSPLEAVKSMATVKLIWVLEEGEQQGVTWTEVGLREGEQGWRVGSLGPQPAAVWCAVFPSGKLGYDTSPSPLQKGLL